MKLKLEYPVTNVQVNQKFGENQLDMYKKLGMKGHNGVDFQAVDGTPILATHNGTVVYAGLDGSNGNLVVLKTDEQYDYLDKQAYYKTLYGHLKTGTFKVTAGDKVTTGQILALADNTGMSTGSHLHFGLKPVQQGEQEWVWFNIEGDNGYNGAIDPMPYFTNEYVNFLTPLKKGDTGFEVEKLQAFLLRNKYMSPVDKLGYYGDISAQAILKFQIANIKNLSWYERYVLRGSVFGVKSLEAINRLNA